MCSERAEKMADRWRRGAVSLVNKKAEVYQTNHFQGGRCLVAIEQYVPQDSKMVRIIDAFENNAVGDYLEMYNAFPKPNRISVCEVGPAKCSSLSEFRHLIHQKFGFAEEGNEKHLGGEMLARRGWTPGLPSQNSLNSARAFSRSRFIRAACRASSGAMGAGMFRSGAEIARSWACSWALASLALPW